MKHLAVKNFETFQHYKDRAPTWIKLYNALLDDYAFVSLPDAARSHLMLIWLIASRHSNRIPYDAAYIARAIHAKGRVDLATLIAAGFLLEVEQDASDGLAHPEQRASDALARPSRNGTRPRAMPEHAASPRARGRALAREREEGEQRQNTAPSGAASTADVGDAVGGAVMSGGDSPDVLLPVCADQEGAAPSSVPGWPGNWPVRFAAIAAEKIGEFAPSRFGAAFRPRRGGVDIPAKYDERTVADAMRESIDDAVLSHRVQFWTPESFAQRVKYWIDETAKPLQDPRTGALTAKGRKLAGVG